MESHQTLYQPNKYIFKMIFSTLFYEKKCLLIYFGYFDTRKAKV